MNDQQLLLPRRVRGGGVRWREPTVAAISSMLRNPTYAGAYAYGKTRFVPQDSAPHKRRKRRITRDQWKVLIEGHHPGYVEWEEFMKIQGILENNHAEYARKQTSGAVRSGAALLQGIVYCGRCGHQMTIQYRQSAKYTCNYLHQQRRLPVCAVIRADRIDSKIEEMFWQALRPEEFDLLEEAESQRLEDAKTLRTARDQQLQRLRYQAELAERRYQECDPGNRLVAAELEQRWEQALRSLRQEEDRLQRESRVPVPTRLTGEQRLAWETAGTSLRELWSDGRLSSQQKKRVLRALIDKVVVKIDSPGVANVRLVWRGGQVDQEAVSLKIGRLAQLPECSELEGRIASMAREGLHDEWIAYCLSKEGFRQSHLFYVSASMVSRVRQEKRILRETIRPVLPKGYLTLFQTGRRTGVPVSMLFELIVQGRLQFESEPQSRQFLIPNTTEMLEMVKKLAAQQRPTRSQPGVST